MIHHLKTWPAYFERVADGSKTFEIRRNDRAYQAGDVLILKEWMPFDPVTPGVGQYTGRQLTFHVGFVAAGPVCGLDLGEFVVLSLIPKDVA